MSIRRHESLAKHLPNIDALLALQGTPFAQHAYHAAVSELSIAFRNRGRHKEQSKAAIAAKLFWNM